MDKNICRKAHKQLGSNWRKPPEGTDCIKLRRHVGPSWILVHYAVLVGTAVSGRGEVKQTAERKQSCQLTSYEYLFEYKCFFDLQTNKLWREKATTL